MPIKIKIKKGPGSIDASTWETAIEAAHADLVGRVDRMWDELDIIFQQPGRGAIRRQRRADAWALNASFVLFLGARINNEEIIDVRRRVRKLYNRVHKDVTYVIVTTQTGPGSHWCIGTTSAYVVPMVEGPKIHLCPRWITQTPWAQSTILVHEIMHKLGVFGRPHFGTTTRTAAIALAASSPKKARKSPENYEQLAVDLAPAVAVEVVTVDD